MNRTQTTTDDRSTKSSRTRVRPAMMERLECRELMSVTIASGDGGTATYSTSGSFVFEAKKPTTKKPVV